jgi:hypothetical protein
MGLVAGPGQLGGTRAAGGNWAAGPQAGCGHTDSQGDGVGVRPHIERAGRTDD